MYRGCLSLLIDFQLADGEKSSTDKTLDETLAFLKREATRRAAEEAEWRKRDAEWKRVDAEWKKEFLAARSDGASTVQTTLEYEEAGAAYLRANFPRLFGLNITTAGRSPSRSEADIPETPRDKAYQWDFRVSCDVSGAAPEKPSETFRVFQQAFYAPPAAPIVRREHTPPRHSGEVGYASHFLGIFEITSSPDWADKDMMYRLEARLRISVDRSNARLDDGSAPLTVDEVVAVLGIVSPVQSHDTVCSIINNTSNKTKALRFPMLKTLMDKGRFVWVYQKWDGPELADPKAGAGGLRP